MKRSVLYTAILILSAMLVMATGTMRNAEAQVFTQDLMLQSSTTSPGLAGKGGGTTTDTEYFSKNATRMSSSDGKDTIVRFDTEKFITLDTKQKTYTEMTFKQMQEMLSKTGEALNQMKGEQLAAMRKMMGGMATTVTVTKVGPGETIAGHATQKYLFKGPMDIEIHAASDLKIPPAYYDMVRLRMPSNPVFDIGKMFDEMKKLNGIPLKTVTNLRMMGQEMRTTKIVTSIKKGPIPASVFEIPAGYKQVPFGLNP
jgi:hypothetical protein